MILWRNQVLVLFLNQSEILCRKEVCSLQRYFRCGLLAQLFDTSETHYKQLLDSVFVISGIIKVEVSVISRSRRLRLITLTETSNNFLLYIV